MIQITWSLRTRPPWKKRDTRRKTKKVKERITALASARTFRNLIKKITGCPKSSFLYFISLYFSTIGLGKQIIETKVVSFNLIHYFHNCCAIFWLEYSICVLPRQRCAYASIFSSHIFLVFYNLELELLPCFLWISRKINPLNAQTFS